MSAHNRPQTAQLTITGEQILDSFSLPHVSVLSPTGGSTYFRLSTLPIEQVPPRRAERCRAMNVNGAVVAVSLLGLQFSNSHLRLPRLAGPFPFWVTCRWCALSPQLLHTCHDCVDTPRLSDRCEFGSADNEIGVPPSNRLTERSRQRSRTTFCTAATGMARHHRRRRSL